MESFEDLDEGLTQTEFREAFDAYVASWSGGFMLEAVNSGKKMPVGFAVVWQNGGRVEPHVRWFGWATPRNKLECCAQLIKDLAKNWLVVIFIPLDDRDLLRFFSHLSKMSLIKRTASKLPDWYGPHRDVALYQSKLT